MAIPSFLIRNGGTDFMSRQKNVFDILSIIEKETSLSRSSEVGSMDIIDNPVRSNKRKWTKRFRGKESMFKVPTDPPPRLQLPGQNPKRGRKWIKYSLADVSDYDLSNEGNTAAALNFLKIIKERKEGETAKETVDINTRHLFKTPVYNIDNCKHEDLNVDTPSNSFFVSSKLIMPEYVVGQNKKPRKAINTKIEKTKEIYLDHIHTYEDE